MVRLQQASRSRRQALPVSAQASRLPAVETAVKVEQGYTYADVRCVGCLASTCHSVFQERQSHALLASKALPAARDAAAATRCIGACCLQDLLDVFSPNVELLAAAPCRLKAVLQFPLMPGQGAQQQVSLQVARAGLHQLPTELHTPCCWLHRTPEEFIAGRPPGAVNIPFMLRTPEGECYCLEA